MTIRLIRHLLIAFAISGYSLAAVGGLHATELTPPSAASAANNSSGVPYASQAAECRTDVHGHA